MKLDYDLSDLEALQADLWLFLQMDAIYAQILADPAKPQASTQSSQPQTWQRRYEKHCPGRLYMRSHSLPGRIGLGPLKGLLSQPILPPAWRTPSVLPPIQAESSWVN
jgi:hypothetical protein